MWYLQIKILSKPTWLTLEKTPKQVTTVYTRVATFMIHNLISCFGVPGTLLTRQSSSEHSISPSISDSSWNSMVHSTISTKNVSQITKALYTSMSLHPPLGPQLDQLLGLSVTSLHMKPSATRVNSPRTPLHRLWIHFLVVCSSFPQTTQCHFSEFSEFYW